MRSLPKPVAIGGPRKGNSFPFPKEVGHPIGDYPEKNPMKVQHFFANKFTDHRETTSSF
jgi:hypothetical protein